MNVDVRLTEARSGELFRLNFALRGDLGSGVHGVRRIELVDCYANAIERTLAFLLRQPVSMPRPLVPIQVQIFDIGKLFGSGSSPFTDSDRQGNPYIALPSRNDLPTWEEELRHAAAAAAHETFHAVVWRTRPLRDLMSRAWRWFHEGCAVWTEMQALPGNTDYLRFGMNWCDVPEASLDDDMSLYESGFFVRYLVNRFSPAIISKIWQSDASETPFDSLCRVTGIRWGDLFRDYCRDSFFLNDKLSPAYFPDVFERFGARAIEQMVNPGREGIVTLAKRLPHLACHYYQICSPQKPTVSVVSESSDSNNECISLDLEPIKNESNQWLAVVTNSAQQKQQFGYAYSIEVRGG